MEEQQRTLVALLQHRTDFRRHYEIRKEGESANEFMDRINKTYPSSNWEISFVKGYE